MTLASFWPLLAFFLVIWGWDYFRYVWLVRFRARAALSQFEQREPHYEGYVYRRR